MELQALKAQCTAIRRDIISMLAMAGSGHPGGSLSAVEILAALYGHKLHVDPAHPDMPGRDRFVLSKGHAAPALYATLANNGFFSREEYKHLRKLGGMLQGHPDRNKCPGVDASTGPLGMGLSAAVGMAVGLRMNGSDARVYAILGDGEIEEGTIWEACMSANKFKVDNLCAVLDWNGVQLDGTNDEIMPLGDVNAKFRAFGWNTIEIDGHDVNALHDAFEQAKTVKGQPTIILAHTVKGKGVSFMEGKSGWHGKAIDDESFAQAMKELGGAQ